MPSHPPIHEQVRNARKAAGLTQEELGKLLGYTSKGGQSAVARLERAEHSPTADLLYQLAKALRVDFVISWR